MFYKSFESHPLHPRHSGYLGYSGHLAHSGKKYLGEELLHTRLKKQGRDYYAKLADPGTKEIYNTRFKQIDRNHWTLSSCSNAGVCASGKFIWIN